MAQAHINKEFLVKDKKKKTEIVSIRSMAPPQQHQQQQQQHQQHQQQQPQQLHQASGSAPAPAPSASAAVPIYGGVVEFGQVVRKTNYEKNSKMDLTVQ
jgi:transcription initiation factor TFIID subunit TAF12